MLNHNDDFLGIRTSELIKFTEVVRLVLKLLLLLLITDDCLVID